MAGSYCSWESWTAGAEGSYAPLHELDRTAGNQVVIEDTGSTYGPTWRFYVGGPFVFDEIPASSIASAACAKLVAARTVSFADGEYLLTTDERGQDVLIFTSDGFRSCEGYEMNELVLPN